MNTVELEWARKALMHGGDGPIPRSIALCPECEGELYGDVDHWYTDSGEPVDINLSCEHETLDGPRMHSWYQGDWQYVVDRVKCWVTDGDRYGLPVYFVDGPAAGEIGWVPDYRRFELGHKRYRLHLYGAIAASGMLWLGRRVTIAVYSFVSPPPQAPREALAVVEEQIGHYHDERPGQIAMSFKARLPSIFEDFGTWFDAHALSRGLVPSSQQRNLDKCRELLDHLPMRYWETGVRQDLMVIK